MHRFKESDGDLAMVKRESSFGLMKPGTVHHAAEQGDINAVELLVEKGLKKGYPKAVTLQTREDLLGMFPIHVAAEHGQVEVVEYLLDNQVDVDAGDNHGATPLHLAAVSNHLKVVDQLLQHGCAINITDCEGDTALHWAATKGHVQVADRLLLKGASINKGNKQGWTPLHRAAYNGRPEVTKLLLEKGASINSVNNDGNTPLHCACMANQLRVMELLMDWAAIATLKNARGETALDVTYHESAREIILSKAAAAGTKLEHDQSAPSRFGVRRPMPGNTSVSQVSAVRADPSSQQASGHMDSLTHPAQPQIWDTTAIMRTAVPMMTEDAAVSELSGQHGGEQEGCVQPMSRPTSARRLVESLRASSGSSMSSADVMAWETDDGSTQGTTRDPYARASQGSQTRMQRPVSAGNRKFLQKYGLQNMKNLFGS